MGRAGIELTRYAHAPATATADALAAAIDANADHPSRELLWGSTGTMHAALWMHERTGEARWAERFRRDARALTATYVEAAGAGCRIWTQDLYGRHEPFVGAAHGFAGNAQPLVRGLALLDPGERAGLADAIVRTTATTALRDGAHANWPAVFAPAATTPPRLLVQWCHGAPGMVTSLAALPDPRLDALLDAAGELTWTAGPLAKGASLCHGTAGNGYAFLKLFRRTGDARWLDRARAFAMHAIAQCNRHAQQYGMRRYSLWTGDLGVAAYLWNCLAGQDLWPVLDPEPRG